VRQRFEDTGDLDFTADLKFKDLDLTFQHDVYMPEKAHLVTLKDSSTITMHGDREVTLKSTAYVEDLAALTLFNVYLLALGTFQWGVEGNANVNGGTGDIYVDIDKTADMHGFERFPHETVINEIEITAGTPTTLVNTIYATFDTVSNIAIDFQQDVGFIIKSGDSVKIGAGTAADFYLQSGIFDLVSSVGLTFTDDAEYNQVSLYI
jgi:hypothetical protein